MDVSEILKLIADDVSGDPFVAGLIAVMVAVSLGFWAAIEIDKRRQDGDK